MGRDLGISGQEQMSGSTEERRMRTDWIPDWEGKGEKVLESKARLWLLLYPIYPSDTE